MDENSSFCGEFKEEIIEEFKTEPYDTLFQNDNSGDVFEMHNEYNIENNNQQSILEVVKEENIEIKQEPDEFPYQTNQTVIKDEINSFINNQNSNLGMDFANYHLNVLKVIAVAEAFGELDPPRVKRKYWVHPKNSAREELGQFDAFYKNIRQYPDKFFEYYRMSIDSYDELLNKIRNLITKQVTPFRIPISAEQRLTITLRFLSVGMNFVALKNEFSIGRSTISKIIKETCEVIWSVIQPTELPEPSSEQWLDISDKFYAKSQFPNCVGALDGKHIRCVNPKDSGSIYFNNKKFFSIVLMAVVDSEYCFTAIDVGDSTVFKECPFGKKLFAEQLNLPAPVCLPNTNENPQPFVVVADEAFGLHKNLLRPFPVRGIDERKRVFNFRMTRARRYVECAFGILANKWRVLHTAINLKPDFADIIVKTCCVLHNFVRKRDGYNFEDTLSNNLDELEINHNVTGGRSQGRDVRDGFANYFMEAGAVPFQYRFT